MSAESNKLEKDFWKAYKAGDLDRCNEMYTGLPAADDFDTAAVADTMSLALNSEDVCERFDCLFGFLADVETESIDFDDREVRSLKAIDDNYPKTVLSLDMVVRELPDGLMHMNVVEWLLG
jgi:hypothetical protein